MLDISMIAEELRIYFFLVNLQPWARRECLRYNATTLDETCKIHEALEDYWCLQPTPKITLKALGGDKVGEMGNMGAVVDALPWLPQQ